MVDKIALAIGIIAIVALLAIIIKIIYTAKKKSSLKKYIKEKQTLPKPKSKKSKKTTINKKLNKIKEKLG